MVGAATAAAGCSIADTTKTRATGLSKTTAVTSNVRSVREVVDKPADDAITGDAIRVGAVSLPRAAPATVPTTAHLHAGPPAARADDNPGGWPARVITSTECAHGSARPTRTTSHTGEIVARDRSLDLISGPVRAVASIPDRLAQLAPAAGEVMQQVRCVGLDDLDLGSCADRAREDAAADHPPRDQPVHAGKLWAWPGVQG
jgi:hypothetical protein